MPARKVGLLERERLATRLAAALAAPDVDLLWLDGASLDLRGHVVQQGTLLERLRDLAATESAGDAAFTGRYLVQA